MIVKSVSKMSIDASGKFFKPNCMYVNEKLKIKFKMNGRSVANEISFLKYLYATYPNDIAIKI